MINKKTFNAVIMFMLIFSFFKTSSAQRATARFLLWNPSATSMAKGGVGVSFYENATSAYFNPANLTELEQFEIIGTYVKPMPFFDNIVHSYVAGSFKIQNIGYFSISGNLFWKAKQIILNEESYLMKKINRGYFFSWQAKISYAFDLNEWLSLGIGLGYLHYYLSDSRTGTEGKEAISNVFMIDIGILAKHLFKGATIKLNDNELPDYIRKITSGRNRTGVNIGLSLNNLGPAISMADESQSDPLPLRLLAGSTYWLLSNNYINFALSAEAEMHFYEDDFFQVFRTGGEFTLLRFLSFRNGYVFALNNKRNSFYTWGMGLNFKFLSINISRYNYTLKPSWHYGSTFKWEF
ncbi:MAG: hypothetical protein GXO77_00370 [Calditrichaeota bacterium]|nr:hypothetical protein [Calditrichota bacterium]